MKTSQLYLVILATVLLTGMYCSAVILKHEFYKIDVSDPFKNYISVGSPPYNVLAVAGSNGYPITVTYSTTNDIKVLRSRIGHFTKQLKQDTLFIEFTGANIPMQQRSLSNTPAGIVIHKKKLSGIISTNTHLKINGYALAQLDLTLKGNALIELKNNAIKSHKINMLHSSSISFLENNSTDSLRIRMANQSVANLQKLRFATLEHSLQDSVSIVLSKEVFQNIVKQRPY